MPSHCFDYVGKCVICGAENVTINLNVHCASCVARAERPHVVPKRPPVHDCRDHADKYPLGECELMIRSLPRGEDR
jgi:hypothetical protein